MDIFFQDPSEVPLPPAEVRIRELTVDPWPDSRRVKVYLEVDPFQSRPSAELRVTDPDEQEVATASIIETMNRKIEVTLHLRGVPQRGEYTLRVRLYYASTEDAAEPSTEGIPEASEPEIDIIDRAQVGFRLPEPGDNSNDE